MFRKALFATLLMAQALGAAASDYPSKPIKFIVPYPPGGPTDAMARLIQVPLQAKLKTPVIIENRGGAGGNIGTDFVAKSPADGYTMVLAASGPMAVNSTLYRSMPFDPLKDLAPVIQISAFPLVLVVHPSVPAKSVKEFVAYAKSKPDGLSVANAGLGTPTHLAAVLFGQAADVKLVHVPYRGAAPASTDLIAGTTPAMFNNPVNAVPQVKSGNLRALAVTGANRLAMLPDTPTIAESGYPGFETRTWYGLFGPAKLPAEIVSKLHADSAKALRIPAVADNLVAQGWDITVSPPDRFAVVLSQEFDRWSAVVKGAGIKAGN